MLIAQIACLDSGGGKRVYAAPPPGLIVQDLLTLVGATPVIIVGKVVGIQTGRTSGEGDARLKFNDVRMSVERRLKGEMPPTVIVEQLAAAGRTVTSEVGPPYKRGERYLLFLRPGEDGRYISVTQGRYLLTKGAVHPTEPGLVADKFKGMDESSFIEEIEAIVREGKAQD